MADESHIKKIYDSGPISIEQGRLTGTIFMNIHDIKEVELMKTRNREAIDKEAYSVRKLNIAYKDFTKNNKLQRIEITLFSDNPKTLKLRPKIKKAS